MESRLGLVGVPFHQLAQLLCIVQVQHRGLALARSTCAFSQATNKEPKPATNHGGGRFSVAGRDGVVPRPPPVKVRSIPCRYVLEVLQLRELLHVCTWKLYVELAATKRSYALRYRRPWTLARAPPQPDAGLPQRKTFGEVSRTRFGVKETAKVNTSACQA